MSVLGQRLKKTREHIGLSQIEAAKKLGISNGTLSGYERDYRDPDTTILERMADLYEVTTDYLLGRSDNVTKEEKSRPSVAYYGGKDEITDDEKDYLDKQLEQYREMKKKFMQQKKNN